MRIKKEIIVKGTKIKSAEEKVMIEMERKGKE